ncbi:MAG: methionyl-tRNA formyltransferase [Ignavibacteria bacterium]|nr:methionyl-tRNA formyltransferase [Ignavibacteria bacterium]
MKIIFMGTPEFAVPSLDILLKNNHNIVGVVTVPDKRKGRGRTMQYSDVKKYAIENNLYLLQPEKMKDPSFIKEIENLQPDLIVIVAFRILPKEIFTIPKYGSFNLHASLLPKYRGAAPINWALINGEKETGVTTFFLKETVDTGNIILQTKIPINDDDDAGTIHDKLSEIGAETVLKTVKLIEKGNVNVTSQDNSLASPAPKIFKEDCRINWEQDSLKIYNFIRGLSPYPASYTYLDNKIVKIYKSKLTNMKVTSNPATIHTEDKKLFVNTKDCMIEILELQLEGKKRMSSNDFINGILKNKPLNTTITFSN